MSEEKTKMAITFDTPTDYGLHPLPNDWSTQMYRAVCNAWSALRRRGLVDDACVRGIDGAVEAALTRLEKERDEALAKLATMEDPSAAAATAIAALLSVLRRLGMALPDGETSDVLACGHVTIEQMSRGPDLPFTLCDPPSTTEDDRRCAEGERLPLGRVVGMRARWERARDVEEAKRRLCERHAGEAPTPPPPRENRGIGPDLPDAPDAFDLLEDA